MNTNRSHSVLLTIVCLELLYLIVFQAPTTQLSQLPFGTDGVEGRLDQILQQLRRTELRQMQTPKRAQPQERRDLPSTNLEQQLSKLDERISELVRSAPQANRFATRAIPKPRLAQNHSAWMEFKQSLGEDGLTSLAGARFNFMTYEEVLATFGRPTYIYTADGVQKWIYERDNSKLEADDYYFQIEFMDGFVTRVQ